MTGFEIAALIMMALSAAGSAYAYKAQGDSQEELAKYNAQVERNKALQAQEDAKAKARAQREQAEELEKRQRALYAKSGVTNEGTPLLVMVDAAQDMELAALDIERGGNVAAGQHIAQASLDKWTGKIARQSGNINAGVTLLSGAASMGSTVSAGRYKGMYGG